MQRRTQKGGEGLTNFFPVMGFFGIYDTTRYALQELGSKGGVLSQDSLVLTSLRVLTFLTRAYAHPVIPTHVPLLPLFIDHVDLTYSVSLSNVFILTTHSYAYVAFFNYYPVQYIIFQLMPTSVIVTTLRNRDTSI